MITDLETLPFMKFLINATDRAKSFHTAPQYLDFPISLLIGEIRLLRSIGDNGRVWISTLNYFFFCCLKKQSSDRNNGLLIQEAKALLFS